MIWFLLIIGWHESVKHQFDRGKSCNLSFLPFILVTIDMLRENSALHSSLKVGFQESLGKEIFMQAESLEFQTP